MLKISGDPYKQIDAEEKEYLESTKSITYKLSTVPADIQTRGYQEQWNEDQFYTPSFQRKFIWNVAKASSFIESFLMGLPVPAVFLYEKMGDPRYMIIDGQQRIISIVSFLEGKFVAGKSEGKKFALKGVNNQWAGKTFSDLDGDDKRRLKNAVMRATILRQIREKDDASIYDMFRRFNTGGVALNHMEIRMCTGESLFTDMLKEVNKLNEWREIINKPKKDDRLRDVELILRFFALEEDNSIYEKPMKIFLDKYIDKCKNKDENWVENKKKLFEETINKALSIREDLFKIKNSEGNIRFSTPALESILVALAGAKASPSSLRDSYKKLMNHEEYMNSVNQGKWTTDVDPVTRRIEIAKKVFHNGKS